VDRLSVLYHAVREHLPSGIIPDRLHIADLEVWLARVNSDASFDKNVIKEWIDTLETHIKQGQMKLDFAKLCGRMYTDWLESDDAVTSRSDHSGPQPNYIPEIKEPEPRPVGQKGLEQLAKLRSIILQRTNMDTGKLKAYLDEVFSSNSTMLEDMREGMKLFGKDLRNRTITADDMRWIVESLLASDLMSPDRRAALREFTDNVTILEEVANVINMRLRTLGSWKWPKEGISVEMRRHLHGKYRAFTDPDILDGLFLQWVGVMWSVKFNSDVHNIYRSDAWRTAGAGNEAGSTSATTVLSGVDTINKARARHRTQHFLVGHLPENVNPQTGYDDEPSTVAGDDDHPGNEIGTVNQHLLNIMSTECYLNISLHKSNTIVRTDVEWFGPSLPHESILTILQFFGVQEEWVDFFRTFLRMPIIFPGDKQAQTRERGTPISYALSNFIGEVVLFGMDFAVNQRAEGLFLYRIHDDIWFWDATTRRCAAGWKEMNIYADLVGLKFNKEKTGSATVGGEPHSDLPIGDIRWGFLKFDTSETRFIIDQEQVDEHIKELSYQLTKTKSVLGWISAYNKYMEFFSRNFGGLPSKSFGRKHVMDVTKTLVRIQQGILPGSQGVIEYLEEELSRRYERRDLPRGYFYFPLSMGGLSLRDPLIDILVSGEALDDDATVHLERVLADEYDIYLQVKAEWEMNERMEAAKKTMAGIPVPPLIFMSFERFCEMSSVNLASAYKSLCSVNKPRRARLTPAMERTAARNNNDNYFTWILEAYGKNVVNKIGGLQFVDSSMIPIGLVHLYRTSRIRWDQ